MAQHQRICHRCDAKKLSGCDADLGRPCSNCTNAVCKNTGLRPCCQLKGPGKAANPNGAEPARVTVPPAPTPSATPRARDGPRQQPRSTAQAAAAPHAPTTAPPTAPRVRVPAQDPLITRARDAERQRAKMRVDSRSVRELQEKIKYLEERVTVEERARSAAEKRSESDYDRGYQDGYQKGLRAAKTQALANDSNAVVKISAPSGGKKRTLSQSLGDGQAPAPEIQREADLQPSTSSPAQTGSKADKLGDPSRLKELRQKAIESIARNRGRQAADKWLTDNVGILEAVENAKAEKAAGEKAPEETGEVKGKEEEKGE